MPTNDFLPFATATGADVLSQVSYAALSARSAGFVTGVAEPSEVNKVWRQASVMASMLGAFIAGKGYSALDDGDLTTLETHYEAALAALISATGAVHFGTGTGTTDALAATVSPIVTAWVHGHIFLIVPASTTTSSTPTFSASGLTAKTICLPDGSVLPESAIIAGSLALLVYNSTLDKVVLLNPATAAGWRIPLVGNTTFYVSTSGSDTTGIGTSGAPWRTIQYAIDQITTSYDLRGFKATIQCAAGTYAEAVVIYNPLNGPLEISGDTVTPTNCTWSPAAGNCLTVYATTFVAAKGFKFAAPAASGLVTYRGGNIEVTGNCNFGTCSAYQMYAATTGSRIILSSNYTISGGASCHLVASDNAVISPSGSITATVTGTPAFSVSFARAIDNATLNMNGMTFSGSATGTRYTALLNAVIQTAGGGANFFPGSVAGTSSTGAQYN